jgi:hypothetical protein
MGGHHDQRRQRRRLVRGSLYEPNSRKVLVKLAVDSVASM